MPRRSPVNPESDPVLRGLLAETDEAATAALLVDLCRASPALRHWLWEDFARDAHTREVFARRVAGSATGAIERMADLSGAADAWHEESRRLRAQLPNGVYGGLSWAEVESLIGQYRAGRTDLAAFLLALEWQRTEPSVAKSPRLVRSMVEFLDPVMRSGDVRRLQQLSAAIRLLAESRHGASRRALLGPTDWWKLQTLFYVLRHPRDSYRTRELQSHLASLDLRVSPKELRRFCARHGIRRDMRAGRPRKTAETTDTPAARRRIAERRPGRR